MGYLPANPGAPHKYVISERILTDIANAIREQLNIEDKITIDQYVDYILQIQTPYHEIGE